MKTKGIVISFGRMNPPTIGHEVLVNKVIGEAAKRHFEHAIYLTQTTDSSKNPLSYSKKIAWAKKFFPTGNIVKDLSVRTPFDLLNKLSGEGYTNVVIVVGDDRVPEFEAFKKYTGSGKDKLHFTIEIVSAGKRNPKAKGVVGMSASKARSFVQANDFKNFRLSIPSHVSQAESRDLFNTLRGVLEESAPPSGAAKRFAEKEKVKSEFKQRYGKDWKKIFYATAWKMFSKESKDNIVGGKADDMTLSDIASKHGVSLDKIKREHELGVKVEMEHTDDENIAAEIARDHLEELPNYYSKLKNMEKDAKQELKEWILMQEALDTPFSFVSVDRGTYHFTTDKDITIEVYFGASISEISLTFNVQEKDWEKVGLRANSSPDALFALMKTGNQFRIFATVINIVFDYIKKVTPSVPIRFTAKEGSRMSLYGSLLNKHNNNLWNLGYAWYTTHGGREFNILPIEDFEAIVQRK